MVRLRRFRACGAVLVLLLAVGASAPLGVRHSHAGGDRPHCHVHSHGHHAGKEAAHLHEHANCLHRHDGSHEGTLANEGAELAPPVVAHAHLSFFGFELTLPLPAEDDPSRDDDHSPAAPLRLVDDPVALRESPRLECGEIVCCLAAILPGEFFSVSASGATAAPQVCTAPLCDRARFERSGVLLI